MSIEANGKQGITTIRMESPNPSGEEQAEKRNCACHIVSPCAFCQSLEPHEVELIDNGGVRRVLAHREMKALCKREADKRKARGEVYGFDGPNFDAEMPSF